MELVKNLRYGWYQWYATRELAEELGIDDNLWNELYIITHTDGKQYAYVYVGESTNLFGRLNSHFNGSGKNSTFRKTIGSIRGISSKAEINSFIDRFLFNFIADPTLDTPTKRREKEQEQMRLFLLPLNIKENPKIHKNENLKRFVKELENKRKTYNGKKNP